MKCSLGMSNFLEEISSLSHSVVFLYFSALITEEGFLISLFLFLSLLWPDSPWCCALDLGPALLVGRLLVSITCLSKRGKGQGLLALTCSLGWGEGGYDSHIWDVQGSACCGGDLMDNATV